MAKVKSPSPKNTAQDIRPALTPEAREQQLISLAVNLVEQRLIDGTASSQETTHFLKLASTKARLEKEILIEQKKLIAAKAESIYSQQRSEEMFSEAIKAFKRYSGQGGDEEDEDEFEDY